MNNNEIAATTLCKEMPVKCHGTMVSRTTIYKTLATKKKVERKLTNDLKGEVIPIIIFLNGINSEAKKLERKIKAKGKYSYAMQQKRDMLNATMFYTVMYLEKLFKQKQESMDQNVTNLAANKLYELMNDFAKLKQKLVSIIQDQEQEAQGEVTSIIKVIIPLSYNIKMCDA